MKKKNNRWTL